MASSSSTQPRIVQDDLLREEETSSVPPKIYDVFINHRGPDVKKTLAFDLYSSLQQKGCRAFLDSEEIDLGDSIPSTLVDAIKSSSVQIAIFSKTYAYSPWCLAELALMLETKTRFIPVFYKVKPSDLRHADYGVYREAFANYEKQGRYLNNLENWKRALANAASFSGYELKRNSQYHSMSIRIVSAVQQEVERRKPLHVPRHIVGLNEIVSDIESHWGQNAEESVSIIGIYGMGGLGKTTLAKQLFSSKRSNYNGSCFLSDVREASDKGELTYLQNKMHRDLFNKDCPNFESVSDGIANIKRRLQYGGKYLIVLDDIDAPDQLDALLLKEDLGSESSVIVTTRDKRVLIRARITVCHGLKEMDPHYATELFSWHAFDQPSPANGYDDLVQSFVHFCRGLPLSLEVMGGLVSGSNDKSYWNLVLDQVKKTLPGGLKQTLKISFDALVSEEKEIFLDIACFFIGKPMSMAKRIWKGSGWTAELAIQNLKDKCLVEVGDEVGYSDTVFRMHDHLRDMGRDIADEMSHPRRLWHPKFLKSLENRGFQTILKETNGRCSHSIFDRSIRSKITYFIGESNSAETSTELLWLELDLKDSQLKSIPYWIPLQKLQYIRIVDGRLKRLWQDDLLVFCSSWIRLPILQCFMSIIRSHQKRLCPSDAEVPFDLKELLLETTVLREFPNTLGELNHLENLILKGSYSDIFNFPFLRKGMLVQGKSFSESLRKLTYLRNLVMWDFFLNGELALSNSNDAASFGSSTVSCMKFLKSINIRGVKLTSKISISGENCPSLDSLRLDSMENLVEVDLRQVTTLSSLKLMFCKKLETVSGSFDDGKLETLKIKECDELQELPNLSCLACLSSITVDQCQKLQNIEGIEELDGLKYLYLSTGSGGSVWNCVQRLERLPSEFTTVMGRAVDGAKSILNAHFFSDLVSADAVTELHPMSEKRKREDSAKMPDSVSAIIICALVQSSSRGEFRTPITRWRPFAPGERIVTIVLTGQERVYRHCNPDFNLTLLHAELKQECIVTLNRGEELKALNIFKKIIAQLYQGMPCA